MSEKVITVKGFAQLEATDQGIVIGSTPPVEEQKPAEELNTEVEATPSVQDEPVLVLEDEETPSTETEEVVEKEPEDEFTTDTVSTDTASTTVTVDKPSEVDGFKTDITPAYHTVAPSNNPQYKIAAAVAEGLEQNGFENAMIARVKNNLIIVVDAPNGETVTVSGIGTHLIQDGLLVGEVIKGLKDSTFKNRINITARMVSIKLKKALAKVDYVLLQKAKSAIVRNVTGWILQNPRGYESYMNGLELYLKGFSEFVSTGTFNGLVGVVDNTGNKTIRYRVSIKDTLYDQGFLPYKNNPIGVSENTPRNSHKPLSILGKGDALAALVAFKLINVCGNPTIVAYEAQAAKAATDEKLNELRSFFK